MAISRPQFHYSLPGGIQRRLDGAYTPGRPAAPFPQCLCRHERCPLLGLLGSGCQASGAAQNFVWLGWPLGPSCCRTAQNKDARTFVISKSPKYKRQHCTNNTQGKKSYKIKCPQKDSFEMMD